MRILGISAFYHDSAAALVVDGHVVAAAQEERFTRKKQDSSFPKNAVEFCLADGGLKLSDIDFVAFYDKPFLKFERLLETYVAFAPKGFQSFRMAMPLWLKEKLFQKNLLKNELKAYAPDYDWIHRLLFAEHHQSHAASAFFPSPFREAAILCMDVWFDTMSAAPQLAYAEALAMACFAELPLAALLAWTAWHSLNWAAPREGMITTRAATPATPETTR